MGNLFISLPVPIGSGFGAAVDTSGMGRIKTITVENDFGGSLFVEVSEGGTFSEVLGFNRTGKRVIEVAAKEMRVRREGVVSGFPVVSVSSEDTGGKFASLPVPPNNSAGASVDVTSFGTFNTVVVGNPFSGSLFIETSEDNVIWSQCMTFTVPDNRSKEFTAKYMRVRRSGVIGLIAGNPVVDVGAIDDAMGGGAIVFGPPITVRGPTNAEGVSTDISRADHDHRLEYEVEDEGVLVSARPRMDFVGDGVGAVDDGPNDKTVVTIPGPNLGDGGAVVKRSQYVGTTVQTSSLVYVDGMSGTFVTVPINGTYLVEFEGECENQSASAILEIGISVDSLVAVVANSERISQGPAADTRPCLTSVQVGPLVAGQLVRCLFRKQSGAGVVSLHRRHLKIIKVQ